ncbi:MAG: DUF222 domain-containing protein [Streptosporangiaceae bacterium]
MPADARARRRDLRRGPAQILAAFTAGRGYSADADYSPTSWLIRRNRITKGAARGHLAWARRAAAHPAVVAALAEGTVLTESMARTICGWTGKLPVGCRPAADEGAGVMTGDLTPGCAAVVTAVLEALSAPAGAADTRSREQRYHDALEDAMRRLVAAGRPVQPVRPA